jgi:16S rRNA processing protein RimM
VPPPPTPAPFLEVGRIEKPHGLQGDVVVRLTTNVEERLAPGSVLYTDAAGTQLLEVAASRPHQHRWIVTFAGVTSREDADDLHGKTLFGEPIDDDPDALWIHELIGAEVREADGTERGTVVAVVDNPASDLLELDGGALVPLRFVVAYEEGRVVIDVPAGLFDIDA